VEEKLKLTITVEIDIEESNLSEDEVKDNIIDFTNDLLTNGAAENEIAFDLKEVNYDI
jgi:hypothetical protein